MTAAYYHKENGIVCAMSVRPCGSHPDLTLFLFGGAPLHHVSTILHRTLCVGGLGSWFGEFICVIGTEVAETKISTCRWYSTC